MSKKINFLRAGALTMVLALGTTCFMSGTLAKYVTSGQGSDSARVAKFGVKITATGETFAKSYDKGVETQTVVSAEDDDVVAPGTEGNMSAITITGKPEVAVRVSYDVTEFELTNWTTDGTDQYCPIIINVNGTEYNCLEAADIDSFEVAVKNAINAYSKDYPANADLSGAAVPAVSWKWPFSTSADNDVKDTALGDRAAGIDKDGNAITPAPATIKLTVKTTVTQID